MNKKNTQKSNLIISLSRVCLLFGFLFLNIFYVQNFVSAQATNSTGSQQPPPVIVPEPAKDANDAKALQNQQNQDNAAQEAGMAKAEQERELEEAKAADAKQQAAASQAEQQQKEKQLREESIQGILNTINKEAKLPSFTDTVHRDAPSAAGVRTISSIIFYILDFVKYLVGGIVVFFIVIGAIQIIVQGGDVEEIYKKQKNNILWSVVGLFLIMISDGVIKNVFYGERGEFLQDEASAKLFAQQGANTLRGIYTTAEVIVGAVAVLFIIFHAVRMIAVSQTEDEVGKSRKAIAYAAVGLAVIGISELVVKGILFKDQGSTLGVGEFQLLFIGITNFIASFIGILSLIMFIYAGITMVFNAGNEDAVGKAKNIMTNTIIGILLALAAFAFTNTLIQFKS